jgi:hypothetical protein
MLQITVGASHDINISGLEDILKSKVFEDWQQQHLNEKLKMIFIVHPSVYKEFTKQLYLYNYVAAEGSSKNDSKTRLRNTEKRKEMGSSDRKLSFPIILTLVFFILECQ